MTAVRQDDEAHKLRFWVAVTSREDVAAACQPAGEQSSDGERERRRARPPQAARLAVRQ